MERAKISDTLKRFLTLVLSPESDVLGLALETFKLRSLGFVDCVLYAYHKVRGIEIATFDKKRIRLMAQKAR